MAFSGYLCYGGVEIVSACRTDKYLAYLAPEGMSLTGNCGCCCDDLYAALGLPGQPSTVVNDLAPWYDPLFPQSADLAGLFVEKISGLGPGQFARAVTARAGGGSVIGATQQDGPVVSVTGLILGKTCEAAEYGLAWLRATLRGACPENDCAGNDLTFLTAAPCLPDEDCGPVDAQKLYKPFFRTLRGMTLVDGPDIVELVPRACAACCDCPLMRVSFTLAGTSPCAYGDLAGLIAPVAFTSLSQAYDCSVTWTSDCTGAIDECPDTPDCATDPDCTAIPSPPSVPVPVAACSSSCEPLTGERLAHTITAGTIVATGEAELYLKLYAGTSAMRNIRVRLFANPLGLAATALKDCDACGEFALSYLAASSTFILDGAARTKTVTCPGGSPVDANLTSTSGTRFLFPVIACPDAQYTLVITASTPVSGTATIELGYIPKDC